MASTTYINTVEVKRENINRIINKISPKKEEFEKKDQKKKVEKIKKNFENLPF